MDTQLHFLPDELSNGHTVLCVIQLEYVLNCANMMRQPYVLTG